MLKTMPPSTVEGLRKYMASGLIKGIGPALAGAWSMRLARRSWR